MSREFRFLMTDRAWPDCSIERDILSRVGAELIEAPNGNEATLVALARESDAIGTNWAHVTDKVIRAVPRCRIIARFGIGLDNICIETATELGIPVTNVPDYCVSEVSDHALALILACAEYRLLSLSDEGKRIQIVGRPADASAAGSDTGARWFRPHCSGTVSQSASHWL